MPGGYVESPHAAPEYQINLRGLVLGLQQERPAEESEVVFALLPRPSFPWKFLEEDADKPLAIEQVRFRRWPCGS